MGLMIDSQGSPSVVEFNVRLGIQKLRVTIPLVQSDLGELLLAAAEGSVSETQVEIQESPCFYSRPCFRGYPGSVVTEGNMRLES